MASVIRSRRLAAVHGGLKAVRGRLDALAGEFVRRSRLARQPRPHGVSGPHPRLLVGEFGEFARRKRAAPDCGVAVRPQPVMLIPGFFSHPKRMRPMAEALRRSGHAVADWGMGFNLGPSPENFAFLERRVAQFAREQSAPVALVGWSLGGLFAREIARRRPDIVSRVITMGTPFSGNPRANNAWRAYQAITGHDVDTPPVECDVAVKPPVPTIALWSPRDGVIHPRAAAGWPGERDCAVALRCTHLGFSHRAEVIAEVMRRLDA